MRRRGAPGKLRLAAVLLGSALLIWAAVGEARTVTVTIEGMQFNPQELTVRRGDRIVWVNKDLFPHTVTAASKRFDSHGIASNASWSYTAARRGEYAYGCTFHSTMKGRIKVQ